MDRTKENGVPVSNLQLFYKMVNPIQNYAWGSRTSLNQLFQIDNPEDEHQAEMWMGAHRNGCSQVMLDNGETSLLSELVRGNMTDILGQEIADAFGELPYLFKVLAAEKALSVQVHPSKYQAEAGFAKENLELIQLDEPHRNYKDSNHKPELVYALTPYQAMNGFRPTQEIIHNLGALNSETLNTLLAALEKRPNEKNFAKFFGQLLSIEGKEKNMLIKQLLEHIQSLEQHHETETLILSLADQYPGDIGLLTPLMLNVLTLQPGDAMYLDSCVPHAYISGTALEIMANSDNVLRAGLTPKHIDVQELVHCTKFEETPADKIVFQPKVEGNCLFYDVPVSDFKFRVYELGEQTTDIETQSANIVLCFEGQTTLTHGGGTSMTLKAGESAFIPAKTARYVLTGRGRCARAYN